MSERRTRLGIKVESQRQLAWGGWSRTDRDGFLAGHHLSVQKDANHGSRARDLLLTGLLGVFVFSTVVVGCAVVWPSYLSCHHLQHSTGLIGGQTLTTCTMYTSLWRLTP